MVISARACQNKTTKPQYRPPHRNRRSRRGFLPKNLAAVLEAGTNAQMTTNRKHRSRRLRTWSITSGPRAMVLASALFGANRRTKEATHTRPGHSREAASVQEDPM